LTADAARATVVAEIDPAADEDEQADDGRDGEPRALPFMGTSLLAAPKRCCDVTWISSRAA
jgi:hypothetical protein